jgi:hypothetical protein
LLGRAFAGDDWSVDYHSKGDGVVGGIESCRKKIPYSFCMITQLLTNKTEAVF